MSLREIAESDMGSILSDFQTGFGQSITFTDPSGTTGIVNGFSGDIAQIIDPETGQAVSGRFASIAVSISALVDVSLGIPEGIEDQTRKPWVVQFNDLPGNTHVFKVASSNPDRTLGIVTCNLELYKL